jgi:tetratricopeptide (TPR) repeat protein
MQDIESLFGDAVAAYDRGDFHKAMGGFKELLAFKPHASEIHLNLGNVHLRLTEMEAAENCFRKAIELDPMEANAYLGLGNLYFKQDKTEEAANCWEIYKKLNRQNANVWLNLGIAYDKLGEPVKAMENYSIFLGLNPSSAEAARIKQRFNGARRMFEHNIKVAEELLARGNRQKQVMDILQKALAAYPGTAKMYKTYASLLYQDGQAQEAMDAYRRAWELKPDDPAVLVNLGVLHEKLGQPVQALWAYCQAKTFPGREQAKIAQRFESLLSSHRPKLREELSRAQTLLRQGRFQQAEVLLNQLVQLSEAAPEIRKDAEELLERAQDAQDPVAKAAKTYFAKGKDAETNGQFDQAMMHYGKYLSLKSSGEHADEVRQRLAHIKTLMAAVVQSLLDQP